MKRISYLNVLLVFFVLSCSKKNTNLPVAPEPVIDSSTIMGDYRCIQRVWAWDSHPSKVVSAAQVRSAEQLFNDNNLSFATLKFYSISYDTTMTGTFVHVKSEQYVNGLLYFIGNLGHHFKDGKFNSFSGKNIATSSLDTIPSLTLPQVRKRFVDCLRGDSFGSIFEDSCAITQFGYYNLNLGSNSKPPQFIKVWRVHPFQGSPLAYINDNDGTIISYFNGVEIN